MEKAKASQTAAEEAVKKDSTDATVEEAFLQIQGLLFPRKSKIKGDVIFSFSFLFFFHFISKVYIQLFIII